MHLAVDARPLTWSGDGGIQRICRNLLVQLSRRPGVRITAFVNAPVSRLEDVETVVVPTNAVRYALFGLPAAVRNVEADVLLGLAPELFRPVVPSVLLLYDIYPMFYRQWLPLRSTFSLTFARQVLAARLRLRLLRSLSGAVAISATTAKDVRAAAPDLPYDIYVAPPAVDPDLLSWDREHAEEHVTGLGIERPYLLYVGAINQQKNVGVLVEAFRLLQRRGHDTLQLVIAGSRTWPPIKPDLRDGPDRGVRVLSGLTDDAVGALYAACTAFVFPSLYEGFGMPVLEAMAAGAPVLVAATSSLPEVVGDAGIVFDPRDAKGLADALDRVLTDEALRARLAQSSSRRAASFSWERMADGVWRALDGAVNA